MTPILLRADREGERLDQLLARSVDGLTRSAAQRLLEEGAVTLNGAPARKTPALPPATRWRSPSPTRWRWTSGPRISRWMWSMRMPTSSWSTSRWAWWSTPRPVIRTAHW